MGKILEAPYIDQTEKWPTGCESVSAVMLLQYLKLPVGAEMFIERFLPKEAMRTENGVLCGPDPNVRFAGSPYDADSFGCYPGVMVTALNAVFVALGAPYRAEGAMGVPTETLLREQIDEGMPVLYWTSLDLKPTYRGPSWRLSDGSGEFTWVSNEHCVLLVGYGDGEKGEPLLYCNDPWHNHGCVGYDRALVETRHREQGERAVVVRRR